MLYLNSNYHLISKTKLMYKFLFKNLLLANYSFAKRWVNKKMPERIIPSTLHIFTTPLNFILAGIYCILLGITEYKFKTFLPILIGLGLVMLPFQFIVEKMMKKAIYKWNIEKEYTNLTRNQRWNKNTFSFLFFWFCFYLFFYLMIKYVGGYLVK